MLAQDSSGFSNRFHLRLVYDKNFQKSQARYQDIYEENTDVMKTRLIGLVPPTHTNVSSGTNYDDELTSKHGLFNGGRSRLRLLFKHHV